jgi:hypothetical protein
MSEEKSILDLAAEHTAKVYEAQAGAEKPVFGTGNWKRPVITMNCGVHPDQVEELRAINKTLGVENCAEVLPNGDVKFTNSTQMRRYLIARKHRHYGY